MNNNDEILEELREIKELLRKMYEVLKCI